MKRIAWTFAVLTFVSGACDLASRREYGSVRWTKLLLPKRPLRPLPLPS